jgi:hypothetical protein
MQNAYQFQYTASSHSFSWKWTIHKEKSSLWATLQWLTSFRLDNPWSIPDIQPVVVYEISYPAPGAVSLGYGG